MTIIQFNTLEIGKPCLIYRRKDNHSGYALVVKADHETLQICGHFISQSIANELFYLLPVLLFDELYFSLSETPQLAAKIKVRLPS